jgi:hypothetical protein
LDVIHEDDVKAVQDVVSLACERWALAPRMRVWEFWVASPGDSVFFSKSRHFVGLGFSAALRSRESFF